jgi:hypothetical protein
VSADSDDQTVLFLHLPKTGGITLGCSLRWQYGFRHSYSTAWKTPTSPDPFTDLSRQKRHRLRMIKGHIVYGLHQFLDEPCTYITMIRHPVKRVLSLFYFLRQSWPESEVGGMSLREYLESGHRSYVPNDQVCRIAGHDPKHNGPATADTLEQAKKNLGDHFAACGLTERFDESLVLMKKRLNWSKPPFYVRSNTNSKRPRADSLDDPVLNRIRADHELDLELYSHVDTQLTASVDEMEEFSRDLRQFQSLNRAVQFVASGPLRLFRTVRGAVHL